MKQLLLESNCMKWNHLVSFSRIELGGLSTHAPSVIWPRLLVRLGLEKSIALPAVVQIFKQKLLVHLFLITERKNFEDGFLNQSWTQNEQTE